MTTRRAKRQRRIIEALWIRRNEFAADLTFTPGERDWAEQQIENRLMYARVGKDRYRLKDDWVPTRENVLDGYIGWESDLMRVPLAPPRSVEELLDESQAFTNALDAEAQLREALREIAALEVTERFNAGHLLDAFGRAQAIALAALAPMPDR